MKNIETELISSEITGDWSYLRPVTYVPLWRRIAEGIAFVVVVGGFLYAVALLVSIGAL